MFVLHEQNASKKKYQKPNILRKRPKLSVARPAILQNESPTTTNTLIQYHELAAQAETDKNNQKNVNTICFENIIFKQQGNNELQENCPTEFGFDSTTKIDIFNNKQLNKHKNMEQVSLDVESFLNGAKEQEESIPSLKKQDAETENGNWCLSFNDSKTIMHSTCNGPQEGNAEQKMDLAIEEAPSTLVSSSHEEHVHSQDPVLIVEPTQNVIIDCFTSRAVKFKCDEPDCNKGFLSELNLKKHKNGHNKQSDGSEGVRIAPAVSECPVRKVTAAGGEERCGRSFPARHLLAQHLRDDHTPDDALYRCEPCGRRFFCGVELRAHQAARCARAALACAWPGCTRVFRQPCRLREHARVHTGDRPYSCPFPDCGWSFRSASKLQRHAQRHTGERRHACSVCGRAFLRREHLREHCARLHSVGAALAARAPRTPRTPRAPRQPRQPRAPRRQRAPHAPPATDSEVFIDSNAYDVGVQCELEDPIAAVENPHRDNTMVLNLIPECKAESAESAESAAAAAEAAAEAAAAAGAEEGCGAARTHCPWPLAPQLRAHACLLHHDEPAEQSEASENNIYTIRSDLFLHGNVLINEDSEFVVRESPAALDSGLDYTDVHPTIDLMPEELMYADAAVDESSFRVFLMNGEELT